MKIIIPLAGPDYCMNGIVKGLKDTEAGPLLQSILQSRPWFKLFPSENYKFIFLDKAELRKFFFNEVKNFLPNASAIFIGTVTKGAALSVMSCLSTFDLSNDSPLLIDLADLSFHSHNVDYLNIFDKYKADVLLNTFNSNSSSFSYAKVSKSGKVINLKEKEVISHNALVGTYFFKSFHLYIKAFQSSILNFNNYSFNNLLYISPILNDLLKDKNKYVIKCIKSDLKNDFSST